MHSNVIATDLGVINQKIKSTVAQGSWFKSWVDQGFFCVESALCPHVCVDSEFTTQFSGLLPESENMH